MLLPTKSGTDRLAAHADGTNILYHRRFVKVSCAAGAEKAVPLLRRKQEMCSFAERTNILHHRRLVKVSFAAEGSAAPASDLC